MPSYFLLWQWKTLLAGQRLLCTLHHQQWMRSAQRNSASNAWLRDCEYNILFLVYDHTHLCIFMSDRLTSLPLRGEGYTKLISVINPIQTVTKKARCHLLLCFGVTPFADHKDKARVYHLTFKNDDDSCDIKRVANRSWLQIALSYKLGPENRNKVRSLKHHVDLHTSTQCLRILLIVSVLNNIW